MPRSEPPSLAEAVRVLASPGSVLALVVLALNDHLLKEAWPGWVTGKLSDVAGLVVAPLLLAVLLTALRVPRPLLPSLVVVGVGFAVTKSTGRGAEVVSDVWSLTGITTMIRADVSDLLALPALGAAWWIDRHARRQPEVAWRRVLTLAVGTALLPVGVLATAATSPCDEGVRYQSATRATISVPGSSGLRVPLLLVDGSGSPVTQTVDVHGRLAGRGIRVARADGYEPRACDPDDRTHCWRAVDSGAVVVEVSTDGGQTWTTDHAIEQDEVDELEESLGEICGQAAALEPLDVAVIAGEGGPVVAVPLDRGLLVRDPFGTWRRTVVGFEDDPDVSTLPVPADPPSGATPSGMAVPDEVVTPDLLPEPGELPEPEPSPSEDVGSPTTCPSPSPTTVTPHPSNGPPTTYDVCT